MGWEVPFYSPNQYEHKRKIMKDKLNPKKSVSLCKSKPKKVVKQFPAKFIQILSIRGKYKDSVHILNLSHHFFRRNFLTYSKPIGPCFTNQEPLHKFFY